MKKIKQPKASVFRMNIKTESYSKDTFYEDIPKILRKMADNIEARGNGREKFGQIWEFSRLLDRNETMGYWTIGYRWKDR